MNDELHVMVKRLNEFCLSQAPRLPLPREWFSDALEAAADEYCMRYAVTRQLDRISPDLSVAILPRLYFSRLAGYRARLSCEERAIEGVAEAAKTSYQLEFVLIWLWRRSGKDQWLSGKIGPVDP